MHQLQRNIKQHGTVYKKGGGPEAAAPWQSYFTRASTQRRAAPKRRARRQTPHRQVCLSLLGTWSGPSWQPGVSTLLQVLVSLQACVLVSDPWFNEVRASASGLYASGAAACGVVAWGGSQPAGRRAGRRRLAPARARPHAAWPPPVIRDTGRHVPPRSGIHSHTSGSPPPPPPPPTRQHPSKLPCALNATRHARAGWRSSAAHSAASAAGAPARRNTATDGPKLAAASSKGRPRVGAQCSDCAGSPDGDSREHAS